MFRSPIGDDFNPRSRTGSDAIGMMIAAYRQISIHAPARGATSRLFSFMAFATISIHAPARGATLHFQGVHPVCQISIHAPARGATYSPLSHSVRFSDFNPRSRTGSDVAQIADGVVYAMISIHAPARGATRSLGGLETAGGISIHAPARGATVFCFLCFSVVAISIHAPARGATPGMSLYLGGHGIFQSTLPHGERRHIMCQIKGEVYFNPRSRTGSDYRFLHSALGRKSDFNPRSRTGSDAVDPRTTTTEVISIHAPARGATEYSLPIIEKTIISIHAPARGATKANGNP